jgi:hypothetical protein
MKEMTLEDKILYNSLKSQLRIEKTRMRWLNKRSSPTAIWLACNAQCAFEEIESQIKELEDKYKA